MEAVPMSYKIEVPGGHFLIVKCDSGEWEVNNNVGLPYVVFDTSEAAFDSVGRAIPYLQRLVDTRQELHMVEQAATEAFRRNAIEF